jgi:hypothetical protein
VGKRGLSVDESLHLLVISESEAAV